MKFVVPALVLALLAVGCAKQKPTTTADSSSLMDIQSAPAPAPAPVISQLPPMQPVAPVMAVSDYQSSVSTGGSASLGGTYTIKKGDTLYAIARAKYGDGKQWTKIASANPGVTPSSLKVGQKITLP